VAFVKIEHRPHGLLLDGFTALTLMDLAVRRVAGSFKADVVKSNGTVAIVLFEGGAEAVGFARDVIDTIRALGGEARVGVTHGEVFLFPLGGDQREIAGNPVNVASKLSEDSGLDGILVDTSALTADVARDAQPFTLTLSHVELRGVHIRV
jgi:class 3 adenylate cyclase